MTTNNSPEANKVLDKIAKLLQLQEGRGATEAEAQLAAEHVQRLLQEHNLSLAEVEARGDSKASSAEARAKEELKTSAARPWMVSLMRAIAESNFCLATTARAGAGKRKRHLIVGRPVNVTATRLTYEYLVEALRRAMTELGYVVAVGNKYDRDGTWFLEGAVDRLTHRLRDVRKQREAESTAAEAARRAKSDTSRALVLSDVYGSEADLNNDTLNGFPMGTTAQRRRENQEKMAKREAEEQRLVAEGVDKVEAFYRSHGYGEAEAKIYADSYRRSSSRRSGGRGRSTGWTRGERAKYRKESSAAFHAGREAGSKISLDPQVDQRSSKLLKDR